MVDIRKINIGDKVRCMIKHDLLEIGDVVEVCGILPPPQQAVVAMAYGARVTFKPEDIEVIEPSAGTTPRGIMNPFSDDKTHAANSTMEGTLTARFESQSVTVNDVVNVLAKLPSGAYVCDIKFSMFDHKIDGPMTSVEVVYRIDSETLGPGVAIRGFDAGKLHDTIPCEIINKQGT